MFNTFVANRPAIDFCNDRFRYRLRRRYLRRRHRRRRRRIDGNEIRPIKEGRETGSYLLTLDLAITKRGNSLYNRKFLRRAPARKRIETVPRDYSDRRSTDIRPLNGISILTSQQQDRGRNERDTNFGHFKNGKRVEQEGKGKRRFVPRSN